MEIGPYFKKYLDCYLISYPPGFELQPHVDEISGYRHYRLNIELSGHGSFEADIRVFDLWRFHLFRSDYVHSMKNGDTKRLVLSFGVALPV